MPNANAQRVLVIDDDTSVGQGICDALTLRKYAAVYAENLEQAENFLRQDKEIGIVFVDYHLVGITGPEIIRALAAEFPNRLAYVVITGDDTQNAAVDAMRAQAVDFLNKPVDGRAITTAIQRATESREKLLKHEAVSVLASRVSEGFLDEFLRQNRIKRTPREVIDDLASGKLQVYSSLLRREPVDVVAILRRSVTAIHQMGFDRQVEVRLRVPGNLPAVYTDAGCIASCFRDVVVAMIDKMDAKDRLTVTTLIEGQFLIISFHIESDKFSSHELVALTDDMSLLKSMKNGEEPKLLGPRILAEFLHGEFRADRRSNEEMFLRLFIPRISLPAL